MSIENVKVQYIRKKGYTNLQAWMADTNNVYIGRAGVVFLNGQRFPKVGSPFGNPFKVGKDGTRTEVIEKYRRYLLDRLKDPEFNAKFLELKGKNLGCWCHPEACHGDILLQMVELLE